MMRWEIILLEIFILCGFTRLSLSQSGLVEIQDKFLRYVEPMNETFSNRPHFNCDVPPGGNRRVNGKNAIIGNNYRWRSFDVYIDPAYNGKEREMIRAAMIQIKKSFPCIHYGLWPKGSSPWGDYVHIKRNDYPSCWSYVGKQGGMQEMSMRKECMHQALLVHELLHAIGLEHEHSRHDRDNYITVHYENIEPDLKFAFRKLSPKEYETFGIAYNQNSIMHYWKNSFSKNGRDTISSKRGGFVGLEWPSGKIQDTDVAKLRRMYNC